MIDAFDTSKLGPDSFRVLITDVDYTLPSGEVVANGTEFRNTFHLHELFSGDVFVPCGGRPEAVNLANVGKFLDKNGKPKFKIIVEGANLFFSQNARLKLEEAGAVLYKDASTNKGGVTCSSKEVLAALALPEKFFAANMVVHDPANPPQFYQEYVEDVITVVEADADLEFEIIWSEHERTGEHRHILTDKISTKINDLTVAISNSSLYDDNNLRDNVLGQAVPKKLIDAIGLDQVIVNVPDNYLRAIFSTYVASRFVYKNGIKDNAFALHEHIQELKQ
jgi:glutamate dehydrogenase